jgi:hypothetical protein
VFAQTFTRLHAQGIRPRVLYPAVAIPAASDLEDAAAGWRQGLPPSTAQFVAAGPTFLSINRFERKKVCVCRFCVLSAECTQVLCAITAPLLPLQPVHALFVVGLLIACLSTVCP